jgi:sulfatase maturation enzyme AslB (radical SAM superfamily)
MDARDIIKNKSFCPLPWTGFIVQQSGEVKNCVLAKDSIGDLQKQDILQIVHSKENKEIKTQMLSDNKPASCVGCYKLEENKNSFDIISQRIYYLKELRSVDTKLYDSINNFDLRTADLRWSNQCNQACVYCGPHNSTLWAKEVGGGKSMTDDRKKHLKDYIFSNIKNFKNVYLAGGEPLLMNENQEFLELLMKDNPDVTLRVNTNLSAIESKVGKLIAQFGNVHWTVSVESMGDAYEYIRYGGSWKKFQTNLSEIKKISHHKISFNMLYFILNHVKIFDCIDFLRDMGFHDNSFIIGPIYEPKYLNILNLPQHKIDLCKKILNDRIQEKPGHFLEDSYKNLLDYLNTDFKKQLPESYSGLELLDKRRKLNSKKIFAEVYD